MHQNPMRILLISEDIPTMAKMMTAASAAGFQQKCIDHESDFVPAMENMRKERYGVVVIETHLGGSTFVFQFIRSVKALQPDCRVICLVRRAQQDMEDLLRNGADDFLATDWKYINWPVILEGRIRLWK